MIWNKTETTSYVWSGLLFWPASCICIVYKNDLFIKYSIPLIFPQCAHLFIHHVFLGTSKPFMWTAWPSLCPPTLNIVWGLQKALGLWAIEMAVCVFWSFWTGLAVGWLVQVWYVCIRSLSELRARRMSSHIVYCCSACMAVRSSLKEFFKFK